MKITNKTFEKVKKIQLILGKALNQVQQLNYKLKRSRSNSPTKRRSDQSSQSQPIQEILANLKKGYLMIKHSQKNIQPKSKFVYLSQDNRCICWKSLQKQDQKIIEISSIIKVIKEGAQFCFKGNKIININQCIVIVSPQRNLQLQAKSQIQADYLKYELERVIKYSKSMSLNYKYQKITN